MTCWFAEPLFFLSLLIWKEPFSKEQLEAQGRGRPAQEELDAYRFSNLGPVRFLMHEQWKKSNKQVCCARVEGRGYVTEQKKILRE
jgi:hypothetical protein